MDSHRVWIEANLGVPVAETVVFETIMNLAQIGMETVLGVDVGSQPTSSTIELLRKRMATVECPPDFPPLLCVRKPFSGTEALPQYGEWYSTSAFEWQDCPIAIRVAHPSISFVAWNLPYHSGPRSDGETTANLIIARRQDAREMIRLLGELDLRDKHPRLHTLHGPSRAVGACDWNQMVLDNSLISLLKHDFDFFFESEEWFRSAELPHRRGYLLHGPPGNGKSTAIKCMMTSRGLPGYTLRLFDENTSDSSLEEVFEKAYRNRPALVIFEDIDRAFPKAGGSKCGISVQQLLNTLDGLATAEGIIVVATANEPTMLDSAILRRPGRFDRVVHFPNPNFNLRREYFRGRKVRLEDMELSTIASACDGFSFAQLREAYILAGQVAFARKDAIRIEDLLAGARGLKLTMQPASMRSNAMGFLAEPIEDMML